MNTNAIEIRGLVKRYPGFTLGPLDLNVPRGAIYGFIGPNGAGKTTTIDLIFGMGQEDEGRIEVLGLDHEQEEVAMKAQVGYVSPDLNFTAWGRVGKVVQFVRGFYPAWDQDYCDRLLKEFRVGLEEKIHTLSFGARIKLALALALAWRPKVLVLDEPTVGLDAISKQQVFSELLAAVQDGDRTVLISSHGLTDLERFADHIGLIKEGKLILEGATAEVVDRFRIVDFVMANGSWPSNQAGIYIQKRDQNRCRALVDLKDRPMEWLHANGASQIMDSPVTLEELFISLAKE